jgi:hypothetical protein
VKAIDTLYVIKTKVDDLLVSTAALDILKVERMLAVSGKRFSQY